MFFTRQYMHVFNMLFIAAALYLGVNAFYSLLISRLDYTDISSPFTGSAATAPSETRSLPLGHYKNIENRNLFKTQNEEKKNEPVPPPESDVKQLEETRLKLKLWGTVTGDAERAYAVIEESVKRKQNLYHIGDSVEGAKVKKILREKIIITVNGKDEMLSMEKPEQRKSLALGQAPSPAPVSALPFPFPGAGNNPEARKISLERGQVEDAVNDVNNLMKQAKIRPHFKDGQPDGLTLSRVKRDSIFTKLGLRSGDIITGVDGQKIQSVDDALKFYNSLKSASNVSLEIKRRGRVQQLEYNIE